MNNPPPQEAKDWSSRTSDQTDSPNPLNIAQPFFARTFIFIQQKRQVFVSPQTSPDQFLTQQAVEWQVLALLGLVLVQPILRLVVQTWRQKRKKKTSASPRGRDCSLPERMGQKIYIVYTYIYI